MSPALSADGAYTVTASQADTAGNTGTSGGKSITVDKTAPTVSVDKVNSAAATFPLFTNAASVTSLGGVCESSTGASAVSLLINGVASGTPTCTTNAWTQTLGTALTAEGTYTLNANQTDALGNSGTSGNLSLTIDRTAPVVSISTITTGSGHTVTVTGTASHATGDTLSVTVILCKANSFPCTVPNTAAALTPSVNGGTGAWTTTSGNVSGSQIWARATQTDAANNTGTSGVAGPVTP